jgi:hypothetical protein
MAPETTTAVTSFSKALTLGEIHEDIVFPYPLPDDEEGDRVRALIARFREYAAERLDQFAIDRDAWIPDDVFRDLGDMGLMGRGARDAPMVRDERRPRVRSRYAGSPSRRSARSSLSACCRQWRVTACSVEP